ncbi:ABC transporter permease [Marilutibacter maris]|uniref:ABC transporter permease subunit n=1 Tax=Marilutibacter maris TaxID=1605891 RepID=A0A2U9SZQ0_9GAMM|nr:ABC transporter permease [Lysobacter maris]AWV05806.1 sodium ABC transporter permease [Lysobacter maris]KAB8198566.1 ABC transporter permease subunit [Lysobacter maris]
MSTIKAPGFFATLLSVMRKELRDIARDRRTLALTLFLGPLLYPAMLMGMGYLAEQRARTQLEKELELPVVGAERAPNLIKFLATQSIKAVPAPDDLEAAIARQDHDVGLVIGEDYREDWSQGRSASVEILADSTRRNAEIPIARVRGVLDRYRSQVATLRLMVRGIDPAVAQPVAIGTRDLASAQAKRGQLLSVLLPYLLILSSFLGGAYLIIDATAGERERQSLEPLLATPAPRGAVVSGKIAAACALGLISLLLTLLAFKGTALMAADVAKMLDVSFAAIAKMLFILLPMLLIGTSLLTFLAASAKSMKEAQSHTVWLMLLPMVPTFVLMVNPVKSELWQYVVPFLAQNQLLLKVIRAEPIDPQVWAVYLAAGLGLAALLWFAAVHRYRQERLAISG